MTPKKKAAKAKPKTMTWAQYTTSDIRYGRGVIMVAKVYRTPQGEAKSKVL